MKDKLTEKARVFINSKGIKEGLPAPTDRMWLEQYILELLIKEAEERKEIAMKFAEWIRKNKYEVVNNGTIITYWKHSKEFLKNYTTSELFTIFIEQEKI